jgi:hypothetical protein
VEHRPFQVLYKYFFNHVRRLRLEKLFYLELSRSSSGYLEPLLGPGGRGGRYVAVPVPEAKRLQIYNGYV